MGLGFNRPAILLPLRPLWPPLPVRPFLPLPRRPLWPPPYSRLPSLQPQLRLPCPWPRCHCRLLHSRGFLLKFRPTPTPPPPLSLICLRYHFEGGSEADEWLRPCVYLTHEQLLQCVEHQGFDIALVQPSLQPSLYTSATILSSRGCCVSRRRQFQAWPPLHIQTCIRARCLLHIIILHVPVSLPLPLPVCNTNTEP